MLLNIFPLTKSIINDTRLIFLSKSVIQMKIIYLLAFLFLLVTLISCSPRSPTTLSDLQVTACTSAQDAGTCESRLLEVGIVLPEECCRELWKCCE